MKRQLTFAAILLSTLVSSACTAEADVVAMDPALGWVPPPSGTVTAYADCLQSQGVQVGERIAAIVVVTGDARLADGKQACKTQLEAHLRTIGGTERKVKDERTKTFIDMLRWCTNYRGKWDQPANEPVFDKGADEARTRIFFDCVEEIRAQPTPPAEG